MWVVRHTRTLSVATGAEQIAVQSAELSTVVHPSTAGIGHGPFFPQCMTVQCKENTEYIIILLYQRPPSHLDPTPSSSDVKPSRCEVTDALIKGSVLFTLGGYKKTKQNTERREISASTVAANYKRAGLRRPITSHEIRSVRDTTGVKLIPCRPDNGTKKKQKTLNQNTTEMIWSLAVVRQTSSRETPVFITTILVIIATVIVVIIIKA